jgi:hypothetical protein
MKRLFKLLLTTTIVLLLLPLFVVFGLFIYGSYFNPDFEQTMKDMTAFLEKTGASGNGFGGEDGFVILDSGRSASKIFFWIDNENLIFSLAFNKGLESSNHRNFVWNTRTDTSKPLRIDGPITCFREGSLYHVLEPKVKDSTNEAKRGELLRSTLKELDDEWVVVSTERIREMWKPPSPRHDLQWSRKCKPWFPIRPKYRISTDAPEHRFTYLAEWGWILRMPNAGPQYWEQRIPKMGFIDLGEDVYYGQKGTPVAGLIDLPAADLPSLELIYINYLDKYWLANRLFRDITKTKFLGFISRSGEIQALEWPAHWPEYSGIPLPTKKGLFWSGKDYQKAAPSREESGAFVLGETGAIHKVIHGITLRESLSANGCNVAFINSPRDGDRSAATLKVFKVCSSTLHGQELQDAKY